MPPPYRPPIVWGKYPRTIGYVLLTACGVVALVAPAPAVRASTMAWAAVAWAVFIAVGGALSAYGAAFERWIGEFVGLLPLIFAFLVWSLAAFVSPAASSPAGGLLLSGITFIFVARWRLVAQIRRHVARVPGRGPDG